MHHVLRAADIRPVPDYAGRAERYARCSLVDQSVGSVHTGFGLCEIDAGGRQDLHLHSYEESFYVLEGAPSLVLDRHSYVLSPGTCGIIPVGVPHAFIGPEQGRARWLDMLAPQPRDRDAIEHSYFLGPSTDHVPGSLDIRDPRARHFFRFADDDIQVDKLKIGARVNAPKVSSSMATALLAYSGIAVKMLVDQRLDAALLTMFMVEYQPGGVARQRVGKLAVDAVLVRGGPGDRIERPDLGRPAGRPRSDGAGRHLAGGRVRYQISQW
jgi:mannose-6-phosphate isomerase-like protein (cupin superfamily)